MPQKRKSRGRSKGRKGAASRVQCCQCGSSVPKDKAKKVTVPVRLVDSTLAKELRQQGAILPHSFAEKYYCVSCAVHRHIVNVRAKAERRSY